MLKEIFELGPWGVAAAVVISICLAIYIFLDKVPGIGEKLRKREKERNRREIDKLQSFADGIDKFAAWHIVRYVFAGQMKLSNSELFIKQLLFKLGELRNDPVQSCVLELDFVACTFLSSSAFSALIVVSNKVASENTVTLKLIFGKRHSFFMKQLFPLSESSRHKSLVLEMRADDDWAI